MASFELLDYGVLVGLMVVSIAIGIYYAWVGQKSNEDFLMGGRNMSVLPVALSLMASFLSPISVLGWPVEVYTKGSILWTSVIAPFVAAFVAAELFLPIFYNLKLTSVNTYLFERYQSKALRVIASITLSISMIPWLGVVLFSPSLVLMATTGLSVASSIFVTGIVVTIYTTIGGIKAVVWTDVVQYILMIAGILALVIKGTISVGGVAEVWRRSTTGGRLDFSNFDFNIYMSNNFWSVVLGTSMVYGGSYSTSQMLVQRTCTLPTIRKAKQVIYVALPGFVTTMTLMTFLGLTVFANYYDCDPIASGKIQRIDELVPLFMFDVLGIIPGLSGLFVACICSASLSTLSSGLNAIAALTWEDLFSKCIPNAKPSIELWITKMIAIVVGVLCILMAFISSEIGTIFEASFALSGAPIGPIFAIFFMGIFLPFVNAEGAIGSLLLGQLSCFVINGGALFNKYKKGVLLASTEACDINALRNATIVPLTALQNYTIPAHEPQGWNHLFHISHFIVPVIGFLVTLLLGIIISTIFGVNRQRKIDPNLLNGVVVKLMTLFPDLNGKPVNEQKKVVEIVEMGDKIEVTKF